MDGYGAGQGVAKSAQAGFKAAALTLALSSDWLGLDA